MDKTAKQQTIYDCLIKIWPGGLMPRVEAKKSGLIAPKTLANADSLGIGPERLIVAGHIVYPVKPLSEWLAVK
ncbi:MAG: hypothetical protein JXR80_00585 [Deltaproteobacteria bacterium]|nr:hypothetical protein [Deltaproteobacteria bacterium]